MNPLPVEQHRTFLRLQATTPAEIQKLVSGLNVRALPLSADGSEHGEISVESILLVDVRKPTNVPAAVGNHFEATVEVTYVCGGQSGTYQILGTVPGQSSDGIVVFQWRKTCGTGLLHGFNVKTSDNQDVIINGDVLPSFRKTTPHTSDAVHLHYVGFTQHSLDLVVRGPPPTTSSSFSMTFNVTDIRMNPSPEEAGLSVVLEGAAASGGRLEVGDAIPLALVFDCLISGTTTLEIDFTISNNQHLVQTISFQKNCHVGPLPGFDIIPVGIESVDALAVKDGQARPNYASKAPLAIVGPTQTSVEFEIFTATTGLSIPIQKVWTETTDFEIQKDPADNDMEWLYNKQGQGRPSIFMHPGRGSMFGTGGSVLDSLTKKLFDHGAVSAAHVLPLTGFDGLNGLFQRIRGGGTSGATSDTSGGHSRRLWKPNVRDSPAQTQSRTRQRSIVARTTVAGTAIAATHPTWFRGGKTHPKTASPPTSPTSPTSTPPTLTAKQPLTLSLIHDCLHSGSVVVTVNLVVLPQNAKLYDPKEDPEDPDDRSKTSALNKFIKNTLKTAYQRSQQTIVSFSYVKECLVGRIPGLDISMGTYQPRKKMGYAVFHGLVTPYFMARGGSKMEVREGEEISNFYVSLNNPQWSVVLRNLTVRVTHGVGVMNVGVTVLSARGSKISTWKPHQPIVIRGSRDDQVPRILLVNYDCLHSGKARVALTVSLVPTNKGGKGKQEEQERAFTMSWDKQCRVPPLKGLMVNMNSLIDFNDNMGQEIRVAKQIQVIKHGTPVNTYRPGVHSGSVGKKWNAVRFEVFMDVNATMSIARPFAVSNNPLTNPLLNVYVGSDGDQKSEASKEIALGRNQPFFMNLIFNCNADLNGSSIVTVVLPLRPPLKRDSSTVVKYPVDVSFAITKRCGALSNKQFKWGTFVTSTGGIVMFGIMFVVVSVCIGVLCCPGVVMNVRATLFRTKYKYKRVELDEREEDEEEDERTGGTAVEMTRRKRGSGDGVMAV